MNQHMINLLHEALAASILRGHQMTVGSSEPLANGQEQLTLVCGNKGCDAYVQILPKPAPNQIDIGGTSVALHCPHRDSNGED